MTPGFYVGDCLTLLGDAVDYWNGRHFFQPLPDESVDCVMTSIPYYGLRSYLPEGHTLKHLEIGSEETLDEFIAKQVVIFRAVRRVLKPTGTLWLNIGDSYSTGSGGNGTTSEKQRSNAGTQIHPSGPRDLPPKNLLMVPARVALALQADGWILRSDIIWSKCLSGGTRLYARTQKGDGPHTLKDLVRLDPATVQLWNGERWTRVVSWTETPRPAEPIELKLRSGETIGCTAEHQWPTQRGLLRADELKTGDVLQCTDLPEPSPAVLPQYIPSGLGWFVGLFIAEGSYGKDGQVIQIAGHEKERARHQRLRTIANMFGGTCQVHKTSEHGVTCNIYSPMLRGLLEMYVSGNGSKGKHLHPRCWQRSNGFLRFLLDGYLDGDGHELPGKRWTLAFTQNDELAADLRALAARLGYSLRLKRCKHTFDGRKFPGLRGDIKANRLQHHNTKSDTEIVRIGRSRARKFWDVEVEDEPHLFALASGVLTHNSNPMPESCRDRPTNAHEHLFLFAKRPRYFYDGDAVREAVAESTLHDARIGTHREWTDRADDMGEGTSASRRYGRNAVGSTAGRNLRNVWTIPTQAVKFKHYATFPEKLVEPCIKAGTSQEGVCVECGAPWERVVEVETHANGRGRDKINAEPGDTGWEGSPRATQTVTTTGWRPTCGCGTAVWMWDQRDWGRVPKLPALVLDPFMGSGTVARVCERLGREWIGFDLDERNREMCEKRLTKVQKELLL